MPITKATQSVITPNIVTTDTRQTITGEKRIDCLYSSSSTTSLTIGTGSKTLTIGTGLNWVAGRTANIRNGTSTTKYMEGAVTSYDSTTGVMVVNVVTVGSGTGTVASWVVTQSSSSALPSLWIQSNDTAHAFLVEDSTNPDSTPFIIANNGDVSTGRNLTTGGQVATGGSVIIGNATGGGYGTVSYGGGHPNCAGKNNFIVINQSGGVTSLLKCTNSAFIYPPSNNYSITYNLLDASFWKTPYQLQLLSTFNQSSLEGGGTLQIKVLSYVYATTIATGQNVATIGAYTSPIFVVNAQTNSSNFTGFTLNGVTTATHITTVEGLAQSAGGVPASGYASIQATAATTTAHGAINLTMRGHTTADSPTTVYSSFTTVELICSSLYPSPT